MRRVAVIFRETNSGRVYLGPGRWVNSPVEALVFSLDRAVEHVRMIRMPLGLLIWPAGSELPWGEG